MHIVAMAQSLMNAQVSLYGFGVLTPAGSLLARLLLLVAIVGLIASTVFTMLVIAGTFRFRNQKTDEGAEEFLPPLSLLKPLHGEEPGLEAHLDSFFRQDYPNYEILFCARSANDPGMKIARRVAARHPHIPARFLSTGEPQYINAKVASLELMGAAAEHDLLVISDSDVHVEPGYLRTIAAPFRNERVGALTCVYRGEAHRGLWAHLEAAGMSIEMTAGVVVANMLEGMQFLLGPTMAMRRQCVEQIGGFGVLGSYCADDFMLGKLIAENGHTVVLSQHVIDHVIVSDGFVETQKHQIRWMRSTRFSRPKGHFGTGLTFSVPFGILAFVAAGALQYPRLAFFLLGYSIAARMLLALVVGAFAVRERILMRTVLLYPLRDLLGFLYWAASYRSDLILWRGREFRLHKDGLMVDAAAGYQEDETALSAGI
ncbi:MULTISPECIES: bacteriohopanetetrol glucosamine biosynthesis glycosyltransferase HpnI [Acidobacterium]|nr:MULTISPECIES: bacteriohopanetetrol glucosamine biosynthesis glycosyltransferase HpnI [Acidobacterium]